jgi:glutamate formiminotransferase/formiminotetrahydrofolate cyclodeaminase
MDFTRHSPLVECVPNFSEGRDQDVIAKIAAAIESVAGVKLLDVDPGHATHRTVVTFVGDPEAVVEAAFRAIRRACELIDMRRHRGEHPRMGATDVCPLVPVANVSMEETVRHARELARRVGEELDVPVYLYEHAATSPQRKNLATIREGEYEGLAEKLARPEWRPDYGPAELRPRAGATVIGARDFLVAYNVNLNTTSTRRATAIANDLREKGRKKRLGGKPGAPVVHDADGEPVWEPGALKGVKGLGWFIAEYGIAQVSLNVTDISVTPVHVAFEEACKRAEARGLRVTGSELVGLIPLKAMLDAGRYFLRKQQRSLGVSQEEIVKIAVKSLGLDDLYPFDPDKKIIEYRLRDGAGEPLARLDLKGFADATAAESPAPGGGSVAACVGALGAALGTMVANVSSHKIGWDERWEEFSRWAEQGQALKDELLHLVDEDTRAFNALLAAFRLPSQTPEEEKARRQAVAAATRRAIEVPFQVMQRSLAAMEIAGAMVATGLPSSVSDAAVGALCARAALRGGLFNVKINAVGLEDRDFADETILAGTTLADRAERLEREILERFEERIRSGD